MKIEVLHPTKLSFNLEQLNNLVIKEFNSKRLEEMSRGMLYRDANSLYEKDGKIYTFLKSQLMPTEGGAFSTQEEFDAALEKLKDEEGIPDVLFFGQKNKSALLLLLQEVETAQQILIVKYFSSVSSATKWQEGKFSTETGFKRFKKAKNNSVATLASSQLEELKIKPMDLIGDNIERDPKTLSEHILKKAASLVDSKKLDRIVFEHLQELLNAILSNADAPVLKGGAKYSDAYNVYLSEILGPISFVKNWKMDGDREKAQEMIFGADSTSAKFSEMKISFNTSVSEGLIDSTLVHPKTGNQVFLSSKAHTGAASAVSNFNVRLKEMENIDNKGIDTQLAQENKKFHDKFKKDYPIAYFVIKTIGEQNWWDGPISVAMDPRFSLLDEESKKVLDFLRQNPNTSREQYIAKFGKTPEKLANLCKIFLGTPESITDTSTIKGSYKPFYHLIAVVAKSVAAKINANEEITQGSENSETVQINFQEALKMLLNKFGVIQLNSKKFKIIDKENCQFQAFVAKYPPIFAGKIIIDADKSYWASGKNGKINFKIK